ncbi:MAG: heme-binding domain-containing protein [Ferruginibacter sp.]|nr:heme-binding domain-containing protein [Ferruginibacter sp.]
MLRFEKIILALVLIFVAIQFIQPAYNRSGQVLPADFLTLYKPPENVTAILQNACYDCHSNNTVYPWYSKIQPMAWMMGKHISEGKEELNFSDFGSYTSRRQISKLKSIANQVKDEEMPLTSYKWMHKKANLSKEEKALIIDWMQHKADSLSTDN